MKIDTFIKQKLEKGSEEVLKINKLDSSGNYAYNIITNKRSYVMRLCGADTHHRTKNEIEAEAGLINHLRKQGIPAPELIKLDNSFAVSFKNQNGILYRFIEGKAVKEPTLKQCYAVGEILGRIHKLSKDFKFSYKRKSWDLKETIKKFKEVEKLFLKDEYLQKNNFTERLKLILNDIKFREDLPKGAIHEDLGKRHVLFENNIIKGILDWDRSYSGFLISDLGQAIRGWCIDNWEKLDGKKLQNLLNGYESNRKLSEIEKRSLLNAIKFAFIERIIAFVILAYNKNNNEYKEHAVDDINFVENLSLNFN